MKRGNTAVILLIILGVLLVAFLWFKKSKLYSPQEVSQEPTYQTTADLDGANEELDNTDLNQMDSDLNQISSESSSF